MLKGNFLVAEQQEQSATVQPMSYHTWRKDVEL